MSRTVLSAKFIAGAPRLDALPHVDHPEIAIIGRSNVGKSTFVNRIAGQSKLARTSSTPGRTQEVNLFQFELRGPSATSRPLTVADLPGYGYAKFSKEKRQSMSKLAVDYIRERENLIVVCLLNDVRRAPERDELAAADLARKAGRELLIIATKSDKLTRAQCRIHCAEMADLYGVPPERVVESGEGTTPESFWKTILSVLNT